MSDGISPSSRTSGSNSGEAYDGEADIIRAWARGLAPDPALTVSEWADRYRILSPRASSEAGRYRTDRTPYMRAIMDALSPSHPARRVVFMKAAQVGATEAGNNWIGYCIHQAPGPILAVQPTTDLAKRLSQQRIEPLIEESPELRGIVLPARSRDSGNTVLAKRFAGGQLILAGANSAVGLRSMPARWLFLDEVDAYPGDVDGEGDPIALAEARTRTFGHRRKVFIVSTPTIKGLSRIEREFEATDQRRYFVPCPHCGHMQWLRFERLRWEKGRPDTAEYVCEGCERGIAEHHKTAMLARGEWRATAECADPHVVGFHLSALYSPVGWLSWAQIAREWEAAQGNDAAMKTAKNTLLGETWQERGEAPDWKRLYEREKEHALRVVPWGALVLTAGADVQHDRIEVDVWAWGRGLESWLVDHVVLEGDTSQAAVWDDLTRLIGMEWRHEDGAPMRIARLAIDSGDGRSTSQVYAWVRKFGAGVAAAIKGVDGFDRSSPVDGPTYVDATEDGRKVRRGVRLWKVSVAVFKSETYRLLRLERPTAEETAEGVAFPDGFIHLPVGISAEWVKQLTAEQLVTVRDRRGFSKLEWRQMRERNEALDCRVYARAAAWLLGIDRWTESKWQSLEQQVAADRSKEQPAGQVRQPVKAGEKRKSDWLGGREGGRWFR
ncbi:phage terminase large subunit family protein [Pseudorhodoplanes sp.]|uniref:phage terminase large subunit family protein n=1 Tax=Pseudorhodoplanes sp. TaxID=1934341 RepID=UPI0039193B29